MALSRIKTWGSEVLTFSDLNAEFNNILNNPVSLISPLTAALDLDGQIITLDAAAATSFVSSAGCSWSFTSGAKSGTPATTGSVCNYSAQTFTDSATAGSGTATAFTAFAIQRPTLAATNASVVTTDAAVWYIPNNVAAGTNETITNSWAIWVDAGNVRFDDDIHWLSGQTFAQRGILSHANTGIRTYTFPDRDLTIGPTLGTEQASTSGTSIDFTGIPAGVRRITIMFDSVSTNGTSEIILQLGDAGGFEATGYLGNCSSLAVATVATAAFTTGICVARVPGTTSVIHGAVTLSLEDAANFTWVAFGGLFHSDTVISYVTNGKKALSAELTQVRITMVNGTDAFDAGAINISYE